MKDFSITWGYIVARMESWFGFAPNDDEPMSFHELERYLEKIWGEFYAIKMDEVGE